MQLWRVNSK